MRVMSLNVGRPATLTRGDRSVRTGIVKRPVDGPRTARALNLDGDGQADLRVHGGPDKALYAYPSEHYPRWEEELGRELAYGTFGENLTTSGLHEAAVVIGDRLRVGAALLEVTQPRVPCAKLALRMDDPAFGRRFLASLRSGFYLRVIEEGAIAAGDPIAIEGRGEGALSVSDALHVGVIDQGDVDGARRALAVPALADAWRRQLERRLDGR